MVIYSNTIGYNNYNPAPKLLTLASLNDFYKAQIINQEPSMWHKGNSINFAGFTYYLPDET